MKRLFKILLLVFGPFLVLWIIARVTGVIQLYKSPTPANEPTLKAGRSFFASNLVKPMRFDFICFEAYDPYFHTHDIVTYRLCGMPGDTVEIRSGILYINNEDVDKELRLQHFYKVPASSLAELPEEITSSDKMNGYSEDTSLVLLEDKWVRDHGLKAVQFINDQKDSVIFSKYAMPWSPDNFGPVKVPANSYFVLGDNRSNALDSRYRGFISKDSVLSTVLKGKRK